MVVQIADALLAATATRDANSRAGRTDDGAGDFHKLLQQAEHQPPAADEPYRDEPPPASEEPHGETAHAQDAAPAAQVVESDDHSVSDLPTPQLAEAEGEHLVDDKQAGEERNGEDAVDASEPTTDPSLVAVVASTNSPRPAEAVVETSAGGELAQFDDTASDTFDAESDEQSDPNHVEQANAADTRLPQRKTADTAGTSEASPPPHPGETPSNRTTAETTERQSAAQRSKDDGEAVAQPTSAPQPAGEPVMSKLHRAEVAQTQATGDEVEQAAAQQAVPPSARSERPTKDGRNREARSQPHSTPVAAREEAAVAAATTNAVDRALTAAVEALGDELFDEPSGSTSTPPRRGETTGSAQRESADVRVAATPVDMVESAAAADGGAETTLSPSDRVRFVQRVARAFQMVGPREGEIQLRLSPPELGALKLEVRIHEGRLTARLEAESAAARNLLLDHLPALRERLNEQQIQVERFDIELRAPDEQSSGQTHDGRSQNGQYFHDPTRRRTAEMSSQAPVSNRAATGWTGDGSLNVVV